MRLFLLGVAALSLAACDSGKVPSPAERLQGDDAQAGAGIDENLVVLRGDGLIAGAEAFYFAAGRTEVEAALASALGEATERNDLPECGAGPMASTDYPGGLTVNFQNGNLVGWILGDAENTEATINVSSDAGIGTARTELEAISGYNAIEDSTLGEEFIISGEVAGFVEEDAVSMLYSGVQCFFR